MAAAVEHRCAYRQPVRLQAFLRSSARGRLPARIVNLSGGGLYVELERDDPPPAICAMVDVVVSTPGGADSFRWPAMVVHRSERGVGLMFDRSRVNEVRRLLHGETTGRLEPMADRSPAAGAGEAVAG